MAEESIDAIVIREHLDGRTAREIAAAIKALTGQPATRAGVLGRIYRLRGRGELPQATPPTKLTSAQQRARTLAQATARNERRVRHRHVQRLEVLFPDGVPALSPDAGQATLFDLRSGMCREVIGDPRGVYTRYCGAAAFRRCNCAAHYAKNYKMKEPAS